MAIPLQQVSTNPIEQVIGEINKAGTSIIKSDENFDEEFRREAEIRQAQLKRFNNDTNLKSKLTWFVIAFASLWSITIIVLIYLVAYSSCYLSDKVLITLTTETLCLVLGLPSIVTRHFFPMNN